MVAHTQQESLGRVHSLVILGSCDEQVAANRKATLSVSTPDRSVGKPDGLRYAWSDNAHCNLYNSGGLSLTSKRTHNRCFCHTACCTIKQQAQQCQCLRLPGPLLQP
jgi:hypothetical protein